MAPSDGYLEGRRAFSQVFVHSCLDMRVFSRLQRFMHSAYPSVFDEVAVPGLAVAAAPGCARVWGVVNDWPGLSVVPMLGPEGETLGAVPGRCWVGGFRSTLLRCGSGFAGRGGVACGRAVGVRALGV